MEDLSPNLTQLTLHEAATRVRNRDVSPVEFDNEKRRMIDPLLSVVIAILSASVTAQESYSPYPGQSHPINVYWGDTHLHTSMSSIDAYFLGNRLGPDEAYRFAKGEAVIASNGMVARLSRPLDFLVVADHSENLGVMVALEARDPTLLKTGVGTLRRLRWLRKEIEKFQVDSALTEKPSMDLEAIVDALRDPELVSDRAVTRSVWERVTANADRHNDSGKFTAFIGYEWSSTGTLEKGNLHRVVIFKDSAEKANQVVPFSRYDSKDPA